jgi:hypothetical protein
MHADRGERRNHRLRRFHGLVCHPLNLCNLQFNCIFYLRSSAFIGGSNPTHAYSRHRSRPPDHRLRRDRRCAGDATRQRTERRRTCMLPMTDSKRPAPLNYQSHAPAHARPWVRCRRCRKFFRAPLGQCPKCGGDPETRSKTALTLDQVGLIFAIVLISAVALVVVFVFLVTIRGL